MRLEIVYRQNIKRCLKFVQEVCDLEKEGLQ